MKIRKRKYPSGSIRWELDYGIVDGKRKQKFFKTKAEAERVLDEDKDKRRRHGDSALTMTEEDRIRFAAITERLAAVGATVEMASDFYLLHARPAKGAIKLPALLTKFLWEKASQGKRLRYQQQLKCSCSNFIRGREGREAHTITRDEIKEWLYGQGWAPKTLAVYLGDLRSLFAWALDENYVTINPCLKIALPALESEEVTTMTASQARVLLNAAHTAWDMESGTKFADLLGYAVIGLFCGIRPEEIRRSPRSVIDLDHATVIVTGRRSKTRQRRVVDLSANAVE